MNPRTSMLQARIAKSPCTTEQACADTGVNRKSANRIIRALLEANLVHISGEAEHNAKIYSAGPGKPWIGKTRTKILELLANGKMMRTTELSEVLGINFGSTEDAMAWLCARDLAHVGGYVYVPNQARLWAAGPGTDAVPPDDMATSRKIMRLVTRQRLQTLAQTNKQAKFERERQEGIAKNARMLPFAW